MKKNDNTAAPLDALAARAERALDLSRQVMAGSRVDPMELELVLAAARRDHWLRQGLPDRRSRVRPPGEPMPPHVRRGNTADKPQQS